MTTKTSKFAIDCVAMKRKAQADIAKVTRGMTHEEEIAYYERSASTGAMGEFWRSLGGGETSPTQKRSSTRSHANRPRARGRRRGRT